MPNWADKQPFFTQASGLDVPGTSFETAALSDYKFAPLHEVVNYQLSLSFHADWNMQAISIYELYVRSIEYLNNGLHIVAWHFDEQPGKKKKD